jgi:hypothetical protein
MIKKFILNSGKPELPFQRSNLFHGGNTMKEVIPLTAEFENVLQSINDPPDNENDLDFRDSLLEIEKELNVKTANDLYRHYRDMFDSEVKRKICKDLERTVIDCDQFKVDPTSKENPLYNVLNAYAMYDREISYCQGMNFIVALLLKHLKSEEDSFFCLVHVMENHKWKYCFDMQTTKLIQLLDFLEQLLQTAWPAIYEHLMNEIEISLVPAFSSIIQTIFIYDSPIHTAT